MTEVATDPLVVFTPSGRRGRFPTGTTVLDAARQLGVDIDSVCGGHGLCGRCQVEPTEGRFAKHGITSAADHLSPPPPLEIEFGSLRGVKAERRLGCLAEVRGDVVVDVPPESQVHRQVVRKDPTQRSFELDPVVRLYYVEVEPPALASPSGDLGRLQDALAREWDLHDLDADLEVVGAIARALREGDWKVTVAVHDGDAITAAWPGFHDRAYGVAIDIGSTTIAAHLADLTSGEIVGSDGVMNPQIRYGEDLMSRVSYAMLHADGTIAMTKAVRGAVARLVAQLAKTSGVARTDILEVTVVGNPVMHHLFLGLDPIPLGTAPFALATDAAVRVSATRLGLPVNAGARTYVLPCVAGHVGADAAGVMLAETPHTAPDIRLVIDVGTNAEILLGGPGVLLAASSPTGPAFEGAQIELRPARGSRGDRTGPHRSRDARAPLPGHRFGDVVGRPGLRGRDARLRGERHLRLRHRRGHRRALPRGRHHVRRGHRWRARRRAPPGSFPRAARSRTSSTKARRGSSSRRRTCGPSSSRRPPPMPVRAC